jgi:hypothetical protein
MITVQTDLPDGVHVSTREYEASHGHPNATAGCGGTWVFEYAGGEGDCAICVPGECPGEDCPGWLGAPEALDADGRLWLSGDLLDVLQQLPAGDWVMLP